MKILRSSVFSCILTSLVCVSGLVFFHWVELKSDFHALTGDIGDSRLVVYLSNIWFEWFRGGIDSLYSPPFFFPAPQTLGYSHALFFHGLCVSFLRLLGLDPFHAVIFAIIFFSILNFYSMFFLLRKGLQFSLIPALIGSFFFAFNSAHACQANHLQLAPLFGLPLIWYCLISWWRHTAQVRVDNSTKGFYYLAVAAIIFSMHLMTDIYAPWFFACFNMFLLMFFLFVPEIRRAIKERFRANKKAIFAASAVFIVSMLPFLFLYVPIASELGLRVYGDAAAMLPRLVSYLWMGEWNYIWGDFVLKNFPSVTKLPFQAEHAIGIGVCFSLVVIGSMIWGVKGLYKAISQKIVTQHIFLQLLASTILFYFLISLHYGSWSPWKIIFEVVPGAKSIRAVSRGMAMLALPISILVTFWIEGFFAKVKQQKLATRFALGSLFVVVLAFGFAEQRTGFVHIDARNQETGVRKLMKSLPANCKSFYLKVDSLVYEPDFAAQIDAMLVSLYSGVPTLNGYSGKSPRNWDFYEVKNPNYQAKVDEWIARYSLVDVCALNLTVENKFN